MLQRNIINNLGSYLRKYRELQHKSQQTVAKDAGLSVRHYQDIEYGNRQMRWDTLTKILDVYNVTVFNFFESFVAESLKNTGNLNFIPGTPIESEIAFYFSFDLDMTLKEQRGSLQYAEDSFIIKFLQLVRTTRPPAFSMLIDQPNISGETQKIKVIWSPKYDKTKTQTGYELIAINS